MDKEKSLKILKEELAAIEHGRWSHWQQYLHSQCVKNPDGSLTIPKELVEKWKRQSETKYSSLEEKEKESDREQVEKYFPLLVKFIK